MMRPTPITPNRAASRLTVAEIAADLHMCAESVRGLLRDGVIPSIPLNRGWLVTRQAYEGWRNSAGRERRLAS